MSCEFTTGNVIKIKNKCTYLIPTLIPTFETITTNQLQKLLIPQKYHDYSKTSAIIGIKARQLFQLFPPKKTKERHSITITFIKETAKYRKN